MKAKQHLWSCVIRLQYRQLLALLLIFGWLIPDSTAWHSWVDHEAPPTVRDGASTHSISDIAMPQLTTADGGDGVDTCTIALASMKRALDLDICRSTCDLSCAAAWNSALRDAGAVRGTGCQALEIEVNNTFPLSVSLTVPFTNSEWEFLVQACQVKCGSFSALGACTLSETFRLSPPTSICPEFSVTNGDYRYSLLTWNTVRHYVAQDLGCVGGLSVLADDEHHTWVCVHESSCFQLRNYDDLACFKYSHVRSEFHWWGLNSVLRMVPPLFQVEASFCHPGAHGSIRNARSGGEIDPVGISYYFERYGEDGTARESFSGLVGDLGDFGCGKFNMRKDAKYWLQLEAPGYYDWSGWFFSPSVDFVVVASMFPALEPEDPAFCGVGITLHWCPDAARDMDLYLFRPSSNGDATSFDSDSAIYWAYLNETIVVNGTAKQATYLELESDEGPWNPVATYGPESLLMIGDLPTGTYAVLATRWDEEPELQDAPLVGACAAMSLHAPATLDDFVNSTTIGSKGTKGNWWYVYNIYVETQSAETILVSYSLVDEIVNPGPEVDDFGEFVGTFPTGISLLNAGKKVEMFSYHRERRECGSFGLLAVSIRNARNSEEIPHAIFNINGDPRNYSAQENKAVSDANGISGGVFYLEGDYTVVCRATGYLSRSVSVTISKDAIPNYVEVYLIPRDNRTHVLLDWGEVATDLDIYVVPEGVVGFDGKATVFTDTSLEVPVMNRECDPTYVYWGLGFYADEECGCQLTSQSDCVANCALVAEDTAYKPRLSLDRDDIRSGDLNEIGRLSFGPEVITMENLFPGRYHVYVNAYQSFPPSSDLYDPEDTDDVFEGEVVVEVYFGDGKEITRLVQTVSFIELGAKWHNVGYIEVTDAAAGCNGPLTMRQQDTSLEQPELCYTWVTVNTVVPQDVYPIEEVGRAGVAVYSATDSQPLGEATFRVGDGFRSYKVATNALFFDASQGFSGGALFPNSSDTLYVQATGYLPVQEPVVLTCADPATFNTIFMVNNDGLTRLVLRWGSLPADLDFYIVPQQVLDSTGALVTWKNARDASEPLTHSAEELPYAYWDINRDQNPDSCPCGLVGEESGYNPVISLDRDDFSHEANPTGQFPPPQNGPETVTFKDLLPGTYQVYVNAYPELPDTHPNADREDSEVFPPEPVYVDVYLGDRTNTEWRHTVEIIAPADTVWWYVGYLKVHTGECTGPLRRVQQETPLVTIPNEVEPLCYEWTTTPPQDARVSYPLGLSPLAIRVYSAVDSTVLDATVRINSGVRAYRQADYGFASVVGPGFTGGLYVVKGTDNLVVNYTDAQNLDYVNLTVPTVAGEDYKYVFLVPNDGETRFVLRWGSAPEDLDFYLQPVNVSTYSGASVGWLDPDNGLPPKTNNGDTESPYVYWDVGENSCPCELIGNVSGGYNPQLTLDRDDRSHAALSITNNNGPETITVKHLLPGQYQLYVNAYPPEVDETPTFVAGQTVSVDIYLGQGSSGTTNLVETIDFSYANGKWQYIGFLDVYGESLGCSSSVQRVQFDTGPTRNQTEQLCYSWNTVNENRASYPFDSVSTSLQIKVKSAKDSSPLASDIRVSGRSKVQTTTTDSPVVVSIRPAIDTLSVVVSGYLTRSYGVGELQDLSFQTFFMVPNNGDTMFVLKWGAKPADLDFYLLPVNVTSLEGTKVTNWYLPSGGNVSTHRTGEEQYLHYNVDPNSDGCPCAMSANLPGGYSPTLTLDRDDQSHGPLDANTENGPETIAVRQLLPGLYQLHVNAYPPYTTGDDFDGNATFSGPVEVEVYLGRGSTGTTSLHTTVKFDNAGGRWHYVGFLKVSNVTLDSSCAGALQQNSPAGWALCHTWSTVNQQLATYPFS